MRKAKALNDVKVGIRFVDVEKNGKIVAQKKLVKIFIPHEWFEEVKNNSRKWKTIIKKVIKSLWEKHLKDLDIDKEPKKCIKDLKITTEGNNFYIDFKNRDCIRKWVFNNYRDLILNSVKDFNGDLRALRIRIEEILNIIRDNKDIEEIDKILEKLTLIGHSYYIASDWDYLESFTTKVYLIDKETKETLELGEFYIYSLKLENLRGDNALIEMFMEYASEYINEYQNEY